MTNQESKVRHRAYDIDRPTKVKELRVATSKECKEDGHRYIFRPNDNYGCCRQCGDELLT